MLAIWLEIVEVWILLGDSAECAGESSLKCPQKSPTIGVSPSK